VKIPRILRSRRWKTAVKTAKVRKAAKDDAQKVKSNGHTPQRGTKGGVSRA
jgi:hypothetical protein